ncbi:Exocyst complex component EXO70A1 [Dichanthelium oligosanthes]|uniref:Exocyst subunit Exo70 family protein n=1 Tax=Dichanthelium oligosanthes TaxID=888268 RepID=A0A1E5WB97_9POAL|nr:Exocyst complex component EXO70A1 [Dichanthelium oligosanthes]
MDQDDEDRAAASLAAARRTLRAGVDKSRALGHALARAGPRLEEIQVALPALEAAVRPIRAPRAELAAAGPHIDRAVGPAAAVLKVFDAVHGLEPPLLAPGAAGAGAGGDLPGYLAVLAQLEEAHRFLADNCGLAAQWLADIVEYLGDRDLADPRFLADLGVTLDGLKAPSGDLDGGLLAAALDILEAEFRRLLADNAAPLAMPKPGAAAASAAPSRVPAAIVQKLILILDRLVANGRQDRCVAAYIDARGSVVSASLGALGLDYLRDPAQDAQALGPALEMWGRHLEFVVRRLLESERQLCAKVFGQHKDAASACFAEVAAQAGVLDFLRFGRAVADAKKDPIKLQRLLEVFDSLNKLRLDFNRLFGGKACAEIQSQTRDLVKLLIDGAAEIFEELIVQVELQRQMPPPSDAGVPRLVTFVVEYCNRLLGDQYRLVLGQVLTIHRSWRKEVFNDRMLVDAVVNIVKALEANFEVWSKAFDNAIMSYLFMMNTHWHFFRHLKATKLGEILGDAWLREHEQYKEYYLSIFIRDSWGALSPLLNREGLILFSKGRATARDLVKQRLKTFNSSFDEMYCRQSSWVIPDKDLREKTCNLVVQTIVPTYRSYLQNYGPLVDQEGNTGRYVRFTVDDMEKMLSALYMPRPRRAVSFQIKHSSGKITSTMTGLHRSASAVK